MKMFKGNKQAGFSLVELMVVVGIIGILAAIAVPKLQVFSARAKQSEAKSLLNTAYTFQESYITENGAPATTLTAAGYTLTNRTGKNYVVADAVTNTSVGTTNWTASAGLIANKSLCAGVTTDAWTINQSSTLSGSSNPNCK